MLEIKRPVSSPLSPEQVSAIQEAIARHKAVKGGLLPALHAVQGLCGNWLPMEALQLVSQGMDIPYPYLYGVMSFYTMFSPTPRGKYLIRMCESPPCHIWGADDLLEVLQAELGIKVGETTGDGLFTLEPTACLGVCEVSPAMQINEVVFGHLTPERLKNIIADYRAGKTVDYRTLPRTTNPLSDYPVSGDELVLLANVDRIDPLSLDAYLEQGGYAALKKALAMSQEEVVNTVKDSGRRGRAAPASPPASSGPSPCPIPILPSTSSATPMKGSRGPSRTATSWKAILTGSWRAWPSPAMRWGPAVVISTCAANITSACTASIRPLQTRLPGISWATTFWAAASPSTSRCRPAPALTCAAKKPGSSNPSKARGAIPGSNRPSRASSASGTSPPSSITSSPWPPCRPS